MRTQRIRFSFTACMFAVLSFGVSLLSGCTLQTTATASQELVPGSAISGTVHGGSQSIMSAKVYLLAVNPSSYGGPGIAPSSVNASISLLNSALTLHPADSIGSYVLTNNTTGGFSIASDYLCNTGYAQSTGLPVTLSGTEQIYLYVLGGQSAYTPSSANASSGLLVALGSCASPTAKVQINELTTVATAYAFAGFATDATHIGSSGSSLALTGLSNAFLNVANLATVSSGSAAPGSSTLITPVANISTIANILASCVDGLTANSNCSTLFQYTASSGATGTVPTDTATAAINLAHNPWPTDAGMNALYGLAPATGAPFVGGLSAQPSDFTLGLNITGGGLSDSLGIAIDASGNVWASNYDTNSLSEISSSGTALSGSNGYTGGGLTSPGELAINTSGNVWAANRNGYSLSQFSTSGIALSGNNGYTGGGLSKPRSIAIDAFGNVWASNLNSTLSQFSISGTPISGLNGYTGGGLNDPYGIAIDVAGNIWTVNGGNSLSKFANTGTALSGSNGYTGGGLNLPADIAIDASGNVWAANENGYSLSKFSSSGAPTSGSSGYTGGGLTNPFGIAIDSAGNVWAANNYALSVSKFSGSGTALSGNGGFTSGLMDEPLAIAIDGSGNVWATSKFNSGSLSKLIGAASPVVTPIAANLAPPYSTATVNRP